MGGDSLSPKHGKVSTNRKHNPVRGTFYELSDFHYNDIATLKNDKCGSRNSDPQSSEIVSTSDLVSTVSHAWSRARQPLSVLLSKSSSKGNTDVTHGSSIIQYNTNNGTFHPSASAADQPRSDYMSTSLSSVRRDQSNQEYLRRNQNMSCPEASYVGFSFWRIIQARSKIFAVSSVQNSLSTKIFLPNLQRNYVRMSKIALEKVTSCDTVESSPNQTSGCVRTDQTNSSNNLTMGISCNVKDAQPKDLLEHIEATDCVISTASSDPDCENITLRSDVDSPDASLLSHSHDKVISMKEAEVDLPDSQIDQRLKFTHVKDKPQYALAKHEHAFAGAMAGIFVSLCLHPMDTIKTVIQSCRADQKSLHYVGRSIISERGLTGLYRGVSSNIATSAPISAVYTFTYESVKKSLIPLLPKENHSFAHCMAGGSASIATSFIFTPSERIKQQMQVGSHYRNCWTALKEVVQRGGLPSLYTGWTAVLCRNIPHSIIKFYTYESLKQITLPSVQSNLQANTLVTLFCGGLAGSMASLFTTPFDVVKTRLQTQIPGSMTQYAGVFHTLTSIGKTEGLKGLYRGLTPRLVMYMIQGALFFTSYESFKRCFSLDGHSSTECLKNPA